MLLSINFSNLQTYCPLGLKRIINHVCVCSMGLMTLLAWVWVSAMIVRPSMNSLFADKRIPVFVIGLLVIRSADFRVIFKPMTNRITDMSSHSVCPLGQFMMNRMWMLPLLCICKKIRRIQMSVYIIL